MLDHIGLAVADMERSKAFYRAALKPLGLGVVMEVTAEETGADAHAGFGADDKAFFWIGTGERNRGGAHVAFAAETRAEVEAFYRAALAAGGRDNGAPGLRSHYHPNYYGAFVFDPDGNNIEAVCHRPERQP
jgi:catechol 2,3-dioxygenase-like lactoylglutathione lyase family enzyme